MDHSTSQLDEPSTAVALARQRSADSLAAGLDDSKANRRPAAYLTDVPAGPLEDRSTWARVRALFEIDPSLIHLNAGTIGSAPRIVLEQLRTADLEYARHPADPYPPTTFAEPRRVLARDFGCDLDEIAIVQGATDGNARILNGLDLAEGDEVVTTTHECYTMQAPLNILKNRRGIAVRKLTPRTSYDLSAEEIVAMFEAAITPRTKVLQWAAVTFTTGTAMPTRALAELAHRHGLISVVDGAHLPGQFDIDLHAMGIDFLSGSGSKYQCGPLGTGIVYARNKVIPECNPLPLPSFWPVISLWYPIEGELPPRTSGREPSYDMAMLLQKTGTADLSRGPALQSAAEIWDRIGRGHIQRYVLGLSTYLKERIVDHWGKESLYCPLEDESLHSGMVAFQPFGRSGPAGSIEAFAEFEERMEAEHGVNLRFTFFPVRGSAAEHYAIRLAPHLYNNIGELDHAVDAMIRLTAAMS